MVLPLIQTALNYRKIGNLGGNAPLTIFTEISSQSGLGDIEVHKGGRVKSLSPKEGSGVKTRASSKASKGDWRGA